MCRLSWNLGASNSWNPLGLSRPVMGMLYLYNIYYNGYIKNEWVRETSGSPSAKYKTASTVIERMAQCGLLQIRTFRRYLLPPPYQYSIHVTGSSQTITSVLGPQTTGVSYILQEIAWRRISNYVRVPKFSKRRQQAVTSLCQFHEARRPSTHIQNSFPVAQKKKIQCVSTSKTNRLILLWSAVTLYSTKIKTFTHSLRSAHTDRILCVLYGSENKQWLFLWAVFNDVLGTFAKLWKATISYVIICLYAWNNLAPTGRIFMKCDIWVFFENLDKILVPLKSDKNSVYFKWRLQYIYNSYNKTN